VQNYSVENIFAYAWSLLAKNPVIIVPGLVVGFVVSAIEILIGLVAPQGLPAGPSVIVAALASAGFLVTETGTTAMAGAAWQNGTTSLADGIAAFRAAGRRMLATMLIIAAVVIIVVPATALLLTQIVGAGPGFIIVVTACVVLAFYAIYIVPAVVLDHLGARAALLRSATIARQRVLATIAIIVMLGVVSFVASLLKVPLAFIPLLGPIVSAVLSQAITAYATLVIVGEYLNVRGTPEIIAAGSPL
jgi:hypothetical protein